MPAEGCGNHYSNDRNNNVFSFLVCLLFGQNRGHGRFQDQELSLEDQELSLRITNAYYYDLSRTTKSTIYPVRFVILNEIIAISLIEVTLSSVKNPIFVIFYSSLREKTLFDAERR